MVEPKNYSNEQKFSTNYLVVQYLRNYNRVYLI